MRRHNRALRGMDLALSLSYDITTGIICGVLLGCDMDQQTFIRQQLQSLRDMTRHPLLLPVLLAGQQQVLLHEETEVLWHDLLRVEAASGQTGVVVVSGDEHTPGGLGRQKVRVAAKRERTNNQITTKQITNKVLGVVQLASSWESHIKALAQDIKALCESLKEVKNVVTSNPDAMDKSSVVSLNVPKITTISEKLEEALYLTLHKSNTVLWDLEYINKRASAQMTAVSSTAFPKHHDIRPNIISSRCTTTPPAKSQQQQNKTVQT